MTRGASRLRRTDRQKERKMTSPSESADSNAALVLESIEALNAGDTERLLAVVAPDIVIHYAEMPEPLHGRETWQQGFELMRRAFPDLDAHVDDLVAAERSPSA
jgi:ketosteroid isomerase-like protein